MISFNTECKNRQERQALINCICYVWYIMAYAALAKSGKWRPPAHIHTLKVTPWWTASCARAFNHKRHARLKGTTEEYYAAHDACKRVIKQNKWRHHSHKNDAKPWNNKGNQSTHTRIASTQITAQLAVKEPATGNSLRSKCSSRLENTYATTPQRPKSRNRKNLAPHFHS